MRIALVQSTILWENKEANYTKAEQVIADSLEKDNDIQLFLFPEMSFTGFSMHTDFTAESGRETVEVISVLAKKYHTRIGFGWVRKAGSKSENIYTILNSRGEVISEYVKIHPFSYSGEDKKFSGGTEIVKFSIQGIPFTSFICYDLRFPELFRAVASDVHAIIIPANWPARRSEHWKALLKARAIENQVYMIAINCQGDIGGLYYSGDSCVINPNGDVLTALSEKNGIVSFDLVDDVEEYRKAFPVLRDRKMLLYKDFIDVN